MNYHKSFGLASTQVIQTLGTKILSSGVHLPTDVVKSDDIFAEFDSEVRYGIPNNWMSQKMGILERRMCAADATPSSLAIPAARQAIEECADLNPDQIDAVIFCGIERDQPEPATAHIIQEALGLKAGIAFDLSDACFGFINALRVASSLVQTGMARNVLVTTGEITTKLTRSFVKQLKAGMSIDKARSVLGFLSVGDAGGAVVIGSSDMTRMSGFRSFTTRTLSKYHDLCYYKHRKDGEVDGAMQMAKIVTRTVKLQLDIIEDAQHDKNWVKPDFLMVHQVGARAFDQVANLGIVSKDRIIKSYDRLGNVTSATFPINHQQLMQEPRLKEGSHIYGCYNGSGIVAGQFAYTY